MTRFDYSIEHKPGKLLFTADALSRAPCPAATSIADNSISDSEVEFFVLIELYRSAQHIDPA